MRDFASIWFSLMAGHINQAVIILPKGFKGGLASAEEAGMRLPP
jgi:hypothetical protein